MEELKIRLQKFNGEVEALVITNDEELENANALMKKCNKLIKEVKANHKEEIQKYYQLHKQAKASEKEELKPLEKAKPIIKSAMTSYIAEKEKKELEIRKAQQEEEELLGFQLTPNESKADLGGTHVRKTWKARIIDSSLVPETWNNHQLKVIDTRMLDTIAKMEEGRAEIPGVEFYQESTLVVR